MKNITSRGFAAMASMMAAAASSIEHMGSAMRQGNLFGKREPKVALNVKPDNNPAGGKLEYAVHRGNVGQGKHSGGKGAVHYSSVTFSPKKDIGKGPAITLSVRGKSHEFAKRAQRSGQHWAKHMVHSTLTWAKHTDRVNRSANAEF